MLSNESQKGKQLLPRKALEELSEFVDKLLENDDSTDFREPVDWEGLGLTEYPIVITNPMDLGSVRKKLDHARASEGSGNGGYSDAREVWRDIHLIWENCCIYNRKSSAIYRSAVRLRELTEAAQNAFHARHPTLPRPEAMTTVLEGVIHSEGATTRSGDGEAFSTPQANGEDTSDGAKLPGRKRRREGENPLDADVHEAEDTLFSKSSKTRKRQQGHSELEHPSSHAVRRIARSDISAPLAELLTLLLDLTPTTLARFIKYLSCRHLQSESNEALKDKGQAVHAFAVLRSQLQDNDVELQLCKRLGPLSSTSGHSS